jgi:hypothetical protein
MLRNKSVSIRGWVLASCLLVAVGVSLRDAHGAEPGAAQWTLPHAGTTCFNLLSDDPVEGPRIAATRQELQETMGPQELFYVHADGGLTAGETLQVVRRTGDLDHPAVEDVSGSILEVLGVVEVIESNAEVSLLRVVAACREIEVGDYLRPVPVENLPGELPRLPVFDSARLVTPMEDDAYLVMGAVESVLSDSDEPEDLHRQSVTTYELYAQRDLILIDQGLGEGWQLADLAMIYRDRVYGQSGSDPLPVPTVLGRGVVVRTDADSAILQIVDSVVEMHLGDRARKTGSALDFVNNAPSIDCRSERSQLRTGESLRLTAEVSDPDGDPTTVTWRASAGTLSPSQGTAVTWTAAGVGEGPVTVAATVDDGRDGFAECALLVTVAPAPALAAGPGMAAGPEVLSFTCPEFPAGRTAADNRCKAVLDDVALRLRQDPRATAEIVGHSDTTGTDEGNRVTSLQRAENARDYLVETHGIEASRLEARGAGSAEPIAGNDTLEGQLSNRRVEIRVTLPGGQ